jgi:hypothetical protein
MAAAVSAMTAKPLTISLHASRALRISGSASSCPAAGGDGKGPTASKSPYAKGLATSQAPSARLTRCAHSALPCSASSVSWAAPIAGPLGSGASRSSASAAATSAGLSLLSLYHPAGSDFRASIMMGNVAVSERCGDQSRSSRARPISSS